MVGEMGTYVFSRSVTASAFGVSKQPMIERGLSDFGKLPFIEMCGGCAYRVAITRNNGYRK